MSNPIVYSTADRSTVRNTSYRTMFGAPYGAPYGKNPADLYETAHRIVESTKIAHGLSEYRKGLIRKAERVGMTLEQYCKRFNIKL